MAAGTHPQARAQAAQRRRQIFELRLRGATFDDIARMLGMHAQAVIKSYHRELHAIPKEARDRLQKEQKQRIDRQRAKLWTKFEAATDPEDIARYSRELTRLEIREAKLFGLDAPTKLDLTAEITANEDKRLQDLAALVRAMPDEDRAALALLFERAKQRMLENGGGNSGASAQHQS